MILPKSPVAPKHQRPFGQYCTGPDYAAIVLYPWPRNLRWDLGPCPGESWNKLAHQYRAQLKRRRGRWYATFTMEATRRFYLDDLILHEVGHHADWRYSSVATTKQVEDFATQYAATWARELARCAARSERTGRSR
ncbi:MAG: hypothetical protein MJE77_22280 [Proteobacteria bacterium]|nr:hypothetical protein [Pseudomonadota bacterium]